MADYRQVVKHFPAVRDYLQHRRWVRRGDVVAYAPNLATGAFSTDGFGFRHTMFGGCAYGVAETDAARPYGLVLGASHVFGFGLASNRETISSQLSERLGYPCLTICYPEADTRTLHATLARILSSSARPPELVVLFNGGDASRFGYSGRADPLFGSPDFERSAELRPSEAVADDVRRLCHFTSFWTEQILWAVVRSGGKFILADERTFFEKTVPDPVEKECRLGTAQPGTAARFALHKRYSAVFNGARARFRRDVLKTESWPDDAQTNRFIDEFHYRAESLGRLAELIAGRLSS